ncbi:ABC transporter substrate-binding protein [Microvirga splendida]|uniref:ABC transporter substrate-binding protein n=1 Tax=Microvirga splendida TaxID=2795727 RepID=A0ABS0Y397_9HYPH|nr:ABC transporter substrate-binding protein [Microvirga splendida]MBJ6126767.1 ABC transporter substrate-binding protein [Microvirga splendida]
MTTAAAVLIASAVGQPASAETVLKIRMLGDLKIIDPVINTASPIRDMGYMVWDTLFATDADGKIQPQMAEKNEVSADGNVHTITLRDGLKWHDGKPVTAADCVASIERWMQKDAFGKELKANLGKIEAVDAKTLRITMNNYGGLVLQALGKPGANVPFMMPERLAKTPVDQPVTEAIGSGPFKMIEWTPGSRVVYVKNQDYVPRKEPASGMAGGKVAKVDRIERIHIPDDTAAVNALIAGEVDYVENIPPDLIPLVETNKNIEVHVRDKLGKNLQIVLNHKQPPFDNAKVRHAVQYALSQKEFMEAYFGEQTNLYKLCPSVFFCGAPYESSANGERVMTQDFEKAKALLAEAKYDGTPLVVLHPTDQKEQNDWVAVLVQSLRKAGFKVDDQTMDLATMFSRRANNKPVSEGGWHIFTTGWGGVDQMHPATNVYVTGACDQGWFGWACDKELQDLRKGFFAATTDAGRKAAAERIQARVHDVVPYIPMGQNFAVHAWSKKLEGVLDGPAFSFWNVSKK